MGFRDIGSYHNTTRHHNPEDLDSILIECLKFYKTLNIVLNCAFQNFRKLYLQQEHNGMISTSFNVVLALS
jgi:hypothetical protein